MPEPELDWTKLPANLSYLAMPATRYGEIQFESEIMDFLQQKMTRRERNELQALWPSLLRDEETIDVWIDEMDITKHREAALVYFLLHLMALGRDAGLL